MKHYLSKAFLIAMVIIGLTSAIMAQEESNETDAAELAKSTANPLANIISVPFQYNLNIGLGEYDRAQNIINIMPVVPLKLNDKINLINRFIVPIIDQPDLTHESGSTFGIGDMNYSLFFTPAKTGKVIWGLGPAFNIPTRTSDLLGSPEFGIGPTFIVMTMPGNWAFGLTASNVWSYENSDLNSLFSQVFIVYTFPSALFVNFAPTITSNWNADDGEKWTIPLSFNLGKVKVFGKQPIKFILGGSYFAEKPTNGPDWQANFQMVLLFPKSK